MQGSRAWIKLPPESQDVEDERCLWRLAYRSRATRTLSKADLDGLALQAAARNRALGLTGMLLYEHARFAQWLEGPAEELAAVWRSIQADPRHHEIVVVEYCPTQFRLFSQWDMRVLTKKQEFAPDNSLPTNLPTEAEFTQRVAELAVESNNEAILGLLAGLAERGGGLVRPAEIFEAVSRRLGDDWLADACSSMDIAVALVCLQGVVRRLFRNTREGLVRNAARSVLVAPPPGETHLLGAILVADSFRSNGWEVEVVFPKSVSDFVTFVEAEKYAAVALCLSDVLTREDRFPELSQLIRALRSASLNRSLVICVGGRAFATAPETLAMRVGADVGFLSAEEAVVNTRLALHELNKLQPQGSELAAIADDPLLETPLPKGWFWVP